MTPKSLHLDRKNAVVLIVDVQTKLAPAMEPAALARVVKYSRALAGMAKELGLPVLSTVQYPKGLGEMVPEIAEVLPAPPLVKMHFSCGADPGFGAALEATGRRQVILAGIETHVCVFQTTRDLLERGYELHLCADAVASRTDVHRHTALELMRDLGAVITSAETAIFDLLHVSGTEEFKKVAPLVR
ncbi:MAG TPA: hydrolase [Anaeromyxobacteraceae bacterium]|nr:hydrolase [Anaeromyxobacteraceae bacterium]